MDRAALHKDTRATAWQLDSVGDELTVTVCEGNPEFVRMFEQKPEVLTYLFNVSASGGFY